MKPTQKNRVISRLKLAQLDDKFNEKKEYYKIIHEIVYNNREKPINEIINELSESLGKSFSIEKLEKEISVMGKRISANKAHECDIVVKFALAKMNKDKKEIVKYDGLIKLNEAKKEKNRERALELSNSKKYIRNHDHNELKTLKIDEAKEFMDKVLNGEINIDDVDSNLINSYLMELKRGLKNVDLNKYAKFIIICKKLNTYHEKELNQLRETSEYFSQNFDNKLTNIKALDPDIEAHQPLIDSIHVTGENNIDKSVKGYPRKKYNWKKTRLENNKELFVHYLEMIDELLSYNLDGHKVLTGRDLKLLKEKEEFLLDYINEFREINKAYNTFVKKVNTTTDDNVTKLKLIFAKEIIKEDE